jgi:hypothetical protein
VAGALLDLPRFTTGITRRRKSRSTRTSPSTPWIDKLFGTYYYPEDRWPDTYGLHRADTGGSSGADLYPFTRRKAR